MSRDHARDFAENLGDFLVHWSRICLAFCQEIDKIFPGHIPDIFSDFLGFFLAFSLDFLGVSGGQHKLFGDPEIADLLPRPVQISVFV